MKKPTRLTRFDTMPEVKLYLEAETSKQKIDGFGVNINPKYWDNGHLEVVMDVLVHDLGATLFRLDVYGTSNWVDPANCSGREALNDETYRRVYTSSEFRDAWEMARWLNRKGIKPYLNASGIVPRWMCAEDGETLADYESFSEMMVSMLEWARNKENIEFELFGPLNETDIGPPEGPFVSPEAYVQVLEILVDTLDGCGLSDIKLVVPEQAHYSLDYVRPILESRRLAGRIGVIGMHTYGDIRDHRVKDMSNLVNSYGDSASRFWMTEYGDLDETGAKEWYVAWVSTRRLLKCLQDGAQGGLVWDAYDNYHDHDASWSLYGLLRKGIREFTPKKRYYAAKQVYRFVRPGSVQVDINGEITVESPVAAFRHPQHGVTVVGMNELDQLLSVAIAGVDGQFEGYFTTETLDCAKMGTFAAREGILHLVIPPQSIFTLAQV